MIRPILEYADIIFDNCSNYLSNRLEAVQRRAAIICTGAYRHTEHQTLLTELGWDSLQIRRQHRKLIHYFKITKGLTPPYLQTYLPVLTNSTINYNLRRTHNCRPIPSRLTIYQNSFFPKTTRQWNLLNVCHKNANSILYYIKKITTS